MRTRAKRGADQSAAGAPPASRQRAHTPCWARAGTDIEHGAVVLSSSQLMPTENRARKSKVLQLSRSRALHPTCGSCLAPIGSFTMQLLLAAGRSRCDVLQAKGDTAPLLPHWGEASFHECTGGCGELYCSTACRDAVWDHGHQLMCVGRCKDETHPLYQYKVLSLTHCESFLLAAEILCQILCSCATSATFTSAVEELIAGGRGRPWWEVADYVEVLENFHNLAANSSAHVLEDAEEEQGGAEDEEEYEGEGGGGGEEEEIEGMPEHVGEEMMGMDAAARKALVQEAHKLFLASLNDAPQASTPGRKTLAGMARETLTVKRFAAVLGVIEAHSQPVSADAPLLAELDRIFRVGTPEQHSKVLASLHDLFPGSAPVREGGGVGAEGGDTGRLAQLLREGAGEILAGFRGLAFVPNLLANGEGEGRGASGGGASVRHSCAPNCVLRWERAGAGAGALEPVLRAVVKLERDAELTCGWVESSQPLELREAELRRRGLGGEGAKGGGGCGCVKCVLESSPDGLGVEALREMGERSLDLGQHETARLAVTLAQKRTPAGESETHAALLHALAKTHVAAAGDGLSVDAEACSGWRQAEQVWLDAVAMPTTLPELAQKKAVLSAYYPFPLPKKSARPRGRALAEGGGYAPAATDFEAHRLAMGRWAFSTREPVIAHGECDELIAAAEARAREEGGWNTARHYSVPTTDVPVHEVPGAADILNKALEGRIFPAMEWQFGVSRERLRVFDAFIVRYDAAAQRSLPIHTDESLLSGVIALNSPGEFEGGGTWFVDLDRAVRPEKGCCVTFHGSAEHGGSALSSGVRYILALFFYAV